MENHTYWRKLAEVSAAQAPCVPRLGLRIARLREEQGFTQQQLGHLLGVSREYVSMIEGGRRRLNRLTLLQALVSVLDVTVTELLNPPGGPDPAGAHDLALSLELQNTEVFSVRRREGVDTDPILLITDGIARVELRGGPAGINDQTIAAVRRIVLGAQMYAEGHVGQARDCG